jgi:hypothetical protein
MTRRRNKYAESMSALADCHEQIRLLAVASAGELNGLLKNFTACSKYDFAKRYILRIKRVVPRKGESFYEPGHCAKVTQYYKQDGSQCVAVQNLCGDFITVGVEKIYSTRTSRSLSMIMISHGTKTTKCQDTPESEYTFEYDGYCPTKDSQCTKVMVNRWNK